MLANFLDIGDEVPGGVRLERRVGHAPAAATLVEIHDAIFFGAEEAALFGGGADAGTAVQKNRRLAGGVAVFLEVDFMTGETRSLLVFYGSMGG